MVRVLSLLFLFPAYAFAQNSGSLFGEGPPVISAVFERWDVAIKDDKDRAPTLHRDYDLVGVSVARPWTLYGHNASIFVTFLVNTRSEGDSRETLPNNHYLNDSLFGLVESGGKWTYQAGPWSIAPLIYLRLPTTAFYLVRNFVFGAMSGGAGLQAGWWFIRDFEFSLRFSGESSLIDSDHRSVSALSGRAGLTYTY